MGYLCVDGQIILKLTWKSKGEGRVGRGLSGLDTSGMSGSDSEHQALSLSVLYTGKQ